MGLGSNRGRKNCVRDTIDLFRRSRHGLGHTGIKGGIELLSLFVYNCKIQTDSTPLSRFSTSLPPSPTDYDKTKSLSGPEKGLRNVIRRYSKLDRTR